MPFRIDVPTPVQQSLISRYSKLPLKEILTHIRDRLPGELAQGRQAPPPYAAGVMIMDLDLWTSEGLYRVHALYEVFGDDERIELLDLGIFGTPEI